MRLFELKAVGMTVGALVVVIFGSNSSRLRGAEELPAHTDKKQEAKNKSTDRPDLRGPILKGRIVDESNQPLAGAKVTLGNGLTTRWRGQETTTDDDGRYVFDPVTSGGHLAGPKLLVGMTLTHPTHTSRDGQSWWDVAMSFDDRRVEVKDFEMIPGGHLAGTVVDLVSGEAIPHLELRLRLEPVNKSTYLRYATTDEKGQFTEEGLFPGTVVVQVNNGAGKVLGSVKIEPQKRTERRFVVAAKDRPKSAKE